MREPIMIYDTDDYASRDWAGSISECLFFQHVQFTYIVVHAVFAKRVLTAVNIKLSNYVIIKYDVIIHFGAKFSQIDFSSDCQDLVIVDA